MPFLSLSEDSPTALQKRPEIQLLCNIRCKCDFQKQYTATIAAMSIRKHANLQQMVHYAKVMLRCFELRSPLLTPPWKNDADLKPQKFEGTMASVENCTASSARPNMLWNARNCRRLRQSSARVAEIFVP